MIGKLIAAAALLGSGAMVLVPVMAVSSMSAETVAAGAAQTPACSSAPHVQVVTAVAVTDKSDWARLLLKDMAAPETANNIGNVERWMTAENGHDWSTRNNPLNSSYLTGGPGDGTGSYATLALAAAADAANLTEAGTASNGVDTGNKYTDIYDSLMTNASTAIFAATVETSPWASSHYANDPIANIAVGVPPGTATATLASAQPSADCTLTSAPAVAKGTKLPAAVIAQINQAPAPVRAAISFGLRQVGDWYLWGSTGAVSGVECPVGAPRCPGPRYDCSGLTQAAYASAGVTIGRDTYAQIRDGSPVTEAALAPGDLLEPNPGHVQLVLGRDKTGKIWVLEAPETGQQVHVIKLWGFWKARRIIPAA